jgi:hypothetical protein
MPCCQMVGEEKKVNEAFAKREKTFCRFNLFLSNISANGTL